jgi:signal transduction histidine kinase
MGLWGWIGLLVVLWDRLGGPYGRVGPGAYLVEGPQGEVYLGEGRRLWRFVSGRWEMVGLLPGEGRAGAIDAEGSLWVVGLNSVYLRVGEHTRTLVLPQAGWGEAIWAVPAGVVIRGATQSFWIPRAQPLKAYPLPGLLIGADSQGLWIQRADTVLRGYPDRWQVAFLCPAPLQKFVWTGKEGWALTRQGELYRATAGGLFKLQEGARLLTGRYFIRGNQVYAVGDSVSLWKSEEDLYALHESQSGELVWVLTAKGVIGLYPRLGAHWRYVFPGVFTSWERMGEQWVVWQGETAYFPGDKAVRRYPVTLIGAAYVQGPRANFWVWATPKGLMDEEGRFIAEVGYYVKAVAAQGEKLAWAIGRAVTIQRTASEKRQYTFPMIVQGLAWTGEDLWVWGSEYVYCQKKAHWQGEKLGGFIEEGRVWKERLCVRVGMVWLWRRESGWDTVSQAPWLEEALPISPSWGNLLASWRTKGKRYLLLSHGLIGVDSSLHLPPLHLRVTLKGTGLRITDSNRYEIPAEKSFLSLSWEVVAPFLPGYGVVYYQVGEQAPLLASGREVLLNLPSEGEVPIRLLVSHPWYARPRRYEWVVRVIPPWYKTIYARVGGAVLVLLLVVGGVALREWYHQQLRRRLAAERAALAEQVKRQQTQILQNERMANLGVMAAHIAHEINTPLGIIQSALSEVERRLSILRPSLVFPERPPQTPTDRRLLYEAWQNAHPDLPAFLIQQLATLGYTPSQWPNLAPYLHQPQNLQTWLTWIEINTYLAQIRTAAEKLQNRVQRIRTYVREIRESSETSRLILQESLLRTIEFYKPLLRRVQVETHWPPDPLWIEGDPARLDQVWANLIQNAIQAMPPDQGLLRIEIRIEEPHHALILFQDNGHGIPPEIRERIFEPLFTTKAPGEGTGLGLPICRQIIEMHGGTIKLLHSEPAYTLFGVWLPLSTPPENQQT